MTNPAITVYRVASDTKPAKLAGAIATSIRQGRSVELVAIGAGAVNQAVKALAIARGFAAGDGYDLATLPAFTDHQIGNDHRTAIRLEVRPVPIATAAA